MKFDVYKHPEYGWKIKLTPDEYRGGVKQFLHDLPWDKHHVTWEGDHWELDASKEALRELRGFGLDIPGNVSDKIREIEAKEDVEYRVENHRLVMKFPYKEILVKKIKKLDPQYRDYNPSSKEWVIDKYGVELLESEGFTIPKDVKMKLGMEVEEVKIFVYGSKARIASPIATNIEEKISESLRFRPSGFQFMESYKQGSWDGWIGLFKEWDNSFPVGLLPEVKRILEENYNVTVIDDREVGEHIDLDWDYYDLRDYQKEVLKKVLKRGSGTIAMPTGSGKTIIALRIMHTMQLRTVVFVHKKDLLRQWKRRIKAALNYEPGIVGGGEHNEKDITISTLQSAHSHGLDRDYDLMIVDEGHVTPADTFFEVAQDVDAKHRVALTATPWREDNKQMKIWGATGQVIVDVALEDMIDKGWLAKPEFWVLQHNANNVNGDYEQAYKNYIVRSRKRNEKIVECVTSLWNAGYKIYIDVRRIKHGEVLEKLLNDEDVNTRWIYGKSTDDKRKEVLDSFSDGNFVLISTLLKEGIDLPEMNCLILAGAGKSGIQVIQTVGRALRPKEGNNRAIIVDLEDDGRFFHDQFKERQRIMERYYGDKIYEPVYV